MKAEAVGLPLLPRYSKTVPRVIVLGRSSVDLLGHLDEVVVLEVMADATGRALLRYSNPRTGTGMIYCAELDRGDLLVGPPPLSDELTRHLSR